LDIGLSATDDEIVDAWTSFGARSVWMTRAELVIVDVTNGCQRGAASIIGLRQEVKRERSRERERERSRERDREREERRQRQREVMRERERDRRDRRTCKGSAAAFRNGESLAM
jgi:hypothetical protein